MRDSVLTRDQVLRAIRSLQSRTADAIARTSDLAARLGVKAPSVTARVQELAQAGLVRYVPRQGAALTEEGEQLAVAAITRLQLVERFLAEVLHLPAEWIPSEAELMTRSLSDRVLDGIARYLKANRLR